MPADDFGRIEAYVRAHGLLQRLENERIVVIRDFAPEDVARSVAEAVREQGDWYALSDDVQGFHFRSRPLEALAGSVGAAVRALVKTAVPGHLPMFATARYEAGHKLEAHSDKALVNVEDRGVHSRLYAGVWYLTENWDPADGGAFVDLESGDEIVPTFNTFVGFKVPLWHQVTPVRRGVRISVFGWWLAPGRCYEFPGPVPEIKWRVPDEYGL